MDIRYLAGLIDGEGHFVVFKSQNGRGNRHYRALIRLTQSENNQAEQLFDLIKAKYGGIVCYKPKHKMYEWSLYGRQAIKLAATLKPYLIVKHYQAKRLIEPLDDEPVSGRVVEQAG